MKLSKYLLNRLEDTDYTEANIEDWIKAWYFDIYEKDAPRWLAGERWYDRKKRIEKEAKENEEKEV